MTSDPTPSTEDASPPLEGDRRVTPIEVPRWLAYVAAAFAILLLLFILWAVPSVVTIAIGDLTYNGAGSPGPFDQGVGAVSIGGFVTDTAVPANVDLAGRVGMSLLAFTGAPIENFSPSEVDEVVIRWPSGATQTIARPAIDRLHRIREGE